MELLFRQYYDYVCRTVFRIVPNAQVTEDIAQEVFMEIWRRREAFLITTSLKAYLRRAAANRALNYLRDKRNQASDEVSEGHFNLQADPNFSLEATELQSQIAGAIEQLPQRCREVFKLSRLEEMSYQEIADTMGISVKTVENQIVKALKMLRESLRPFMENSLLLIAWLWDLFQ